MRTMTAARSRRAIRFFHGGPCPVPESFLRRPLVATVASLIDAMEARAARRATHDSEVAMGVLRRVPNKALQPTRAAQPNGEREPAGSGPRG
jgi:hypothetical protein